ncbi:Variant surface glycoprotein [Trypanosoma congolense IL3000]|uniref:Variant surface glycoprotein n=1 Tax=Trypanosoma congolense (strain IL3000) TaxID=1068625 RepID=F9WGW8_TRYCI|nr:Variant surface glycoprotein [Trypanosoma congolense IL3000]
MMTAIKIFVAACFCFMEVVVSINGKDHNRAQYNVLCDLLKVAVGRWGNAGESLSPPLREALERTLFGSAGGGTVETLKKELPEDYKEAEGKTSSRTAWCGKPREKDGHYDIKQVRFPGHSATHDLVCLCTAGDHGWPINSGSEKLCGKGPNELGVESKKQGWGIQGQGKDQIQATWTNVTSECLKGDGAGANLQKALEVFRNTLTLEPDSDKNGKRYLLGEGKFSDYPCSGNNQVCVMYYNTTSNAKHKPWWKDLEEAINIDEQMQKTRKEEKRKQKEIPEKKETKNQEKSQPTQEPRTAALTSAPQGSQDAEQENPENISNPIATLEETSGTFIIPPCTWFLGTFLML